MTVLDWILVVIRWVHALAAVAWVGGSIFYFVALRPSLRRAGEDGALVGRLAGAEFRGLVSGAIAVLALTGVILTLSRLTSTAASFPYVAVLSLKIAVALYMFAVAWLLQRRGRAGEPPDTGKGALAKLRRALFSPTGVMTGGIIAIGLADVLDALFERGLVG